MLPQPDNRISRNNHLASTQIGNLIFTSDKLILCHSQKPKPDLAIRPLHPIHGFLHFRYFGSVLQDPLLQVPVYSTKYLFFTNIIISGQSQSLIQQSCIYSILVVAVVSHLIFLFASTFWAAPFTICPPIR